MVQGFSLRTQNPRIFDLQVHFLVFQFGTKYTLKRNNFGSSVGGEHVSIIGYHTPVRYPIRYNRLLVEGESGRKIGNFNLHQLQLIVVDHQKNMICWINLGVLCGKKALSP